MGFTECRHLFDAENLIRLTSMRRKKESRNGRQENMTVLMTENTSIGLNALFFHSMWVSRTRRLGHILIFLTCRAIYFDRGVSSNFSFIVVTPIHLELGHT